MEYNLTSRTLRALNWTYISTIIIAIFQIGITAILARLIVPSAFGLVAMAGIVLRFGSYFAQMGVGPALIQKKTLTEEDIQATFTSSCLMGLLFFLLTYFLAPLAINIFNDKESISIIRAMSISFFLTGLTTTSQSLLRRKLELKTLSIIEISSFIFGYGVIGIICALLKFGVWSIVLASLCQPTVYVLLAYLFVRHTLKPNFNWKVHKRLFSFGGRLSVISFLEFIGFSMDSIIIGRFWGATELGIYSRSFSVVNLPVQYLAASIPKVMFPSFALAQNDLERLRHAYYRGLMIMGVITIPLSLGMIPAARELILTLLGSHWQSGISILQILAVMVPFNMGGVLPGTVCDATGNLGAKLVLQFVFVLFIMVMAGIAYPYGIKAIALVVVIANVIRFLALQFLVKRILRISLKNIFESQLPGLVIAIAIVLQVVLIKLLLGQLPAFVLLLTDFSVCGFTFIFLSFFRPPTLLKNVIIQTLKEWEIDPSSKNIFYIGLKLYKLHILKAITS